MNIPSSNIEFVVKAINFSIILSTALPLVDSAYFNTAYQQRLSKAINYEVLGGHLHSKLSRITDATSQGHECLNQDGSWH